MKILLGSFQCESNTFCDGLAKTGDFEVFGGDDALKKFAATQVFADAGAEALPLIYASALPSGMVSLEAFNHFRDIFIDLIAQQEQIDGIYLYLHGSMYVEEMGSGELELIKAIRRQIGSDIPISLAMDFHANVPPELAGMVNAINGFRTAPHTDHDDTEIRAAKSLLKCIHTDYSRGVSIVQLPFLCGDAAVTDRTPFPEVTCMLEQLDGRLEIISSAFFNSQPWYDSLYTGACALVSAADGSGLEQALKIAKMFWDGRENLCLDNAMAVDEAVEYSLKAHDGVIFVTDSGDNTTAGALGSGTLLLKKYIEKKANEVLVCGIFDSANTNMLLKMKTGERVGITLCAGKNGQQELEITLDVTLKGKGKVFGWAGDEVGEGVHLACDGVDIVLTNARAAFTTPEHFFRMNIEPKNYEVVVLKMGYLFPKLNSISQNTVMALSPGQSTNDFSTLEYKQLKRKMYPIHKDIEWEDIEAEARRNAL